MSCTSCPRCGEPVVATSDDLAFFADVRRSLAQSALKAGPIDVFTSIALDRRAQEITARHIARSASYGADEITGASLLLRPASTPTCLPA